MKSVKFYLSKVPAERCDSIKCFKRKSLWSDEPSVFVYFDGWFLTICNWKVFKRNFKEVFGKNYNIDYRTLEEMDY